MDYKKLGRTKLKVSSIGFGCGPLQVVNSTDAMNLILKAIELGINLIDVDKIHKENEKKVGFVFEKLEKKDIIISTKSFSIKEEAMTKDILDSLKNLKVDSIDIYQLHMIRDEKDLTKRLKESLVSLKKARSEGKIKFIGFSGHHIPTLIKAIKTNEFDTALIPYNIGHTLADELLDIAKEHEVGTIIMKPLGGGFLVNPKFEDVPKEGAEYMNVENALKFVLSDKRVDTALVGFQRFNEIEEAVKIVDKEIKLSPEERFKIKNRILDFLGDNYCRNCKYCLPCYVNESFDITEVLRLEGYYSKYGYKKVPQFIYNTLSVQADTCVNCGECERKCPYNLPVVFMLKQAHMHLSQNLEEENLENKEKEQLIDLIKKLKDDLRKGKKIIHDLGSSIKIKKLGGSIGGEERKLLEAIHQRDLRLKEKDHKIQGALNEKEQAEQRLLERIEELNKIQGALNEKEQAEQRLLEQIEELNKELKEKECKLQEYIEKIKPKKYSNIFLNMRKVSNRILRK